MDSSVGPLEDRTNLHEYEYTKDWACRLAWCGKEENTAFNCGGSSRNEWTPWGDEYIQLKPEMLGHAYRVRCVGYLASGGALRNTKVEETSGLMRAPDSY